MTIKFINILQKYIFPKWLNILLSIIYNLLKDFIYFYLFKKNYFTKNKNHFPIISLGKSLPNNPNTIVHGGRVKLLELKNKFIINEQNCNILYLVSSAMPKNILFLIKSAKKNGIKIVWNQNGVAFPAWAGFFYFIANIVNKIAIHSSDYVIYQSKFCKDSSDRFLGKFKGKYEIIYNSVDINKFRCNKNNLSKSNNLILLLCGSHQAFYRVKIAIQTLNELIVREIEAKLIIAGRLDWKNGEKITYKYINKLKLKEYIEILDSYKQEYANKIYNKADILIHTKYNDPCPTVPIEAMACGLPVITTDSGGMKELIGNDAGICVPITKSYKKRYDPSPIELANAILRIKMKFKNYSNNAIKRAKSLFSSDEWIKRHSEIFKRVLKNEI